jgi:hypothetical protein
MADELAPLQLVPIPPQSLLYGIDIGQMAPSSRHLIQIKADLSHAIKLKVVDKLGRSDSSSKSPIAQPARLGLARPTRCGPE